MIKIFTIVIMASVTVVCVSAGCLFAEFVTSIPALVLAISVLFCLWLLVAALCYIGWKG